MISYGKYFLRIYPLTGKDSLFLVKSCNIKVDGPMISTIWKGPSHIRWNFVSFPFSSWALSNFKTRSPMWKSFLDIMFESKEAFTNAWWWVWVILAYSRCSSSLRIFTCLSCKEEVGASSIYWTKAKEGIANELEEPLLSHKLNWRAKCQWRIYALFDLPIKHILKIYANFFDFGQWFA